MVKSFPWTPERPCILAASKLRVIRYEPLGLDLIMGMHYWRYQDSLMAGHSPIFYDSGLRRNGPRNCSGAGKGIGYTSSLSKKREIDQSRTLIGLRTLHPTQQRAGSLHTTTVEARL